MIAENAKDRQSETQSSTVFVDGVNADIATLDTKIEKLMTAYLENALSLDEYRAAKNKLVGDRQLLKEKLASHDHQTHDRFELTERFLNTCIVNAELADEGTPAEILQEFQKVGSNFCIRDRTVFFAPRGAWKILAGIHPGGILGGTPIHASPFGDSKRDSKTDFEFLRKREDSNL